MKAQMDRKITVYLSMAGIIFLSFMNYYQVLIGVFFMYSFLHMITADNLKQRVKQFLVMMIVCGGLLFPFMLMRLGPGLVAIRFLQFLDALLIGMFMIYEVSDRTMFKALRAIHLPKELVDVMISIKLYITLILEQSRRMRQARMGKAYVAKAFFHIDNLKELSSLMSILFARTMERSRRIELAKKSRRVNFDI